MAKENRGDKRERILASAISAFSENGFYRTRICDIAGAAGVADGTVYLYFESKEQLLAAIFEDSMNRFLSATRGEIENLVGAENKLRHLFELHLDTLTAEPELATVFQIELRHSVRFMQETSRAQLHDYLELIDALIREGQAAGEFRLEIDSWLVTKALFGILDQVATSWVLSAREYRPSTLIAPLMKLVLQGMRPCADEEPAPPAES